MQTKLLNNSVLVGSVVTNALLRSYRILSVLEMKDETDKLKYFYICERGLSQAERLTVIVWKPVSWQCAGDENTKEMNEIYSIVCK